MKKLKFIQDAKLDPGRYYRNPVDVIRDRRLTKDERRDIIIAWEQHLQQQVASAEGAESGAADLLQQLQRVREELEQGHALEAAAATPKTE